MIAAERKYKVKISLLPFRIFKNLVQGDESNFRPSTVIKSSRFRLHVNSFTVLKKDQKVNPFSPNIGFLKIYQKHQFLKLQNKHSLSEPSSLKKL